MKDAGLYLIIAGVAVFVLVFIGKIFAFIANNPILGLAALAIIGGIIYKPVSFMIFSFPVYLNLNSAFMTC